MALPSYVLITPARNEAQFIELTIQSMIAQTAKPLKWVIVSDGSTDGTDEIVTRYAAEHPWIELLRMPERRERHFAGKVYAFRAGYERVSDFDYSAIGSMDADISFDADYFSFLLAKLAGNSELGLVGTPFKDSSMYDYKYVSIEHVSGACQLFRRTCFEDIGGYVPMKSGGIDHVAVLTARMKGWKTRTFTEKICIHHRKMGSAERGVLSARYRVGALDYALGGHPAWEVFRTAYQMTKKPYIVGGLTLGAGYAVATLKREKRPISDELVAFRRREQMLRLRNFLSRKTSQSNSESAQAQSAAQTEGPSPRVSLSDRDRTVLSNRAGRLIINADDWGRDVDTTDRMFECVQRGTVSSVSAMVFMEDSTRAAALALEHGVDAGLHLNLTTPLSGSSLPTELLERQREIAAYLTKRRLNQIFFNSKLKGSFEYVVAAQLDEYRRLYGESPVRIDGHHHMHLAANVLAGSLLPSGTVVRRNFSFQSGEKSILNRMYRNSIDRKLANRHRLVDYLFPLAPLDPRARLDRVLSLARHSVVELETHPINRNEYEFLMGESVQHWTDGYPISRGFDLPQGSPVGVPVPA
jgi:glycosyltransferase involved in cell wall biosynthesis